MMVESFNGTRTFYEPAVLYRNKIRIFNPDNK